MLADISKMLLDMLHTHVHVMHVQLNHNSKEFSKNIYVLL